MISSVSSGLVFTRWGETWHETQAVCALEDDLAAFRQSAGVADYHEGPPCRIAQGVWAGLKGRHVGVRYVADDPPRGAQAGVIERAVIQQTG